MSKRIHPARVQRTLKTKPTPGSPQSEKSKRQKEQVERVRKQLGDSKRVARTATRSADRRGCGLRLLHTVRHVSR